MNEYNVEYVRELHGGDKTTDWVIVKASGFTVEPNGIRFFGNSPADSVAFYSSAYLIGVKLINRGSD